MRRGTDTVRARSGQGALLCSYSTIRPGNFQPIFSLFSRPGPGPFGGKAPLEKCPPGRRPSAKGAPVRSARPAPPEGPRIRACPTKRTPQRETPYAGGIWRRVGRSGYAARRERVPTQAERERCARQSRASSSARRSSYPGLPNKANMFFLYASTPGWSKGLTPRT